MAQPFTHQAASGQQQAAAHDPAWLAAAATATAGGARPEQLASAPAAEAGPGAAAARQPAQSLLRGLGWVLYVAAVFFCCMQREPRWWTLLPFVLPLGYWLGAYLARRMGRPRLQWLFQGGLLLGVVTLLFGFGQAHFGGVLSPQRIRLFYFLQEAAMLWLLVAVFARSLLPGKTPLCSAVAVLSHPVMMPAVWRYTRGVTLAWAVWIAGLWLVSAGLFVAASAQAWAFFSMGLLPVLIAAFFVAEVLLGRRLFLPKADRSSLWATLATVRKVNWTAFFMQLFQGQSEQGAAANATRLIGRGPQASAPAAARSGR
ncbi:MAG: hypothetical protein Q4A28_03495 [Brachymonas sp.]|nr:hypothetical protein [Brachymonas sp.]